MEACTISSQIDQYDVQQQQAADLLDYKNNLSQEFRNSLLSQSGATVGKKNYLLGDVLDEALSTEYGVNAFSAFVECLLIGDPTKGGASPETAALFIKAVLERSLTDLCDQMAESHIEIDKGF